MSASAAEVGRNVICADGWRVTMHVEVRRGPLQGPDRERQGSTNRMSAAMFSGSPHSTRAMMSDRTERHVTSEAADEATGTRTFSGTARGMPGARGVLQARSKGWRRKPEEDLRVARPQQSARHPTAPRAAEPFGIHRARRSVWPRGRVRQKDKLMRSSSVRASSSRSSACSLLTPEPPRP
jgi:hypothetical protein